MPAPFPLADLCGEPRPITLAGRTFMLAPLRVRDLAALGAFAMGRSGDDPIETARMLAADAPDDVRAAAMKAAQDFADAPPPDAGTPAYREATASVEGLVWTVYVCLRRHNEGFGLAEAGELVAELAVSDPQGVARLNRRAFGVHPARAFASLIDPPEDSEPIDWPLLIDRLAESRGWTYDQVGELTLPAFWNALRRGEPIGVEYRPRPGEGLAAMRRRIKRMLGLG